MKYLSVCSGIEAATVAWHSLGWTPVGFSEIEPFPSAVLAHHFPEVHNYGDMTKYKEWNIEPGTIDLMVGGTPCQAFSIAGLRKGLSDPRGNLALVYLGIADHFRPRWLLWENVPGVLSSNGGRDFGSFLGALAELGYGFAYRILDAQFFGVPQRRRRVFVVGYLGDWRPAAAVLFERESLRRDLAPSREAGEEVAGCIAGSIDYENNGVSGNGATGPLMKGSPTGGGYPLPAVVEYVDVLSFHQNASGEMRTSDVSYSLNTNSNASGRNTAMIIMTNGTEITGTLTRRHDSSPCADRGQNIVHRMTAFGQYSDDGTFSTVKARDYKDATDLVVKAPILAFAQNSRNELREMKVVGALSASPGMKQTSYIRKGSIVRRLTPMEAERLQGFPDGWTRIPWKKKPPEKCPDAPRYKACGNSMATPPMRWLGERIQAVEQIISKASQEASA